MHKIIYVAFAGAMLFQSAFAQSDAGPDNGLPDRIVSYFDMTPEVLEGYAPDGNELGMATQLFSLKKIEARRIRKKYKKKSCGEVQ